MDTLIKNGWVFDPAGGISAPEKKDILVRDMQIAQVREAISPSPGVDGREPTVIDARNRLIIPGLINAHLHSHDHYDRGRFDNLPLELWILFIRPWIGAKPLTPREIYLRTIIGAMEMATPARPSPSTTSTSHPSKHWITSTLPWRLIEMWE